MKVQIENTENGFRVIFNVETEKDAEKIHNAVALSLCEKPHPLIGELFIRIHGENFENSEHYI